MVKFGMDFIIITGLTTTGFMFNQGHGHNVVPVAEKYTNEWIIAHL